MFSTTRSVPPLKTVGLALTTEPERSTLMSCRGSSGSNPLKGKLARSARFICVRKCKAEFGSTMMMPSCKQLGSCCQRRCKARAILTLFNRQFGQFRETEERPDASHAAAQGGRSFCLPRADLLYSPRRPAHRPAAFL